MIRRPVQAYNKVGYACDDSDEKQVRHFGQCPARPDSLRVGDQGSSGNDQGYLDDEDDSGDLDDIVDAICTPMLGGEAASNVGTSEPKDGGGLGTTYTMRSTPTVAIIRGMTPTLSITMALAIKAMLSGW